MGVLFGHVRFELPVIVPRGGVSPSGSVIRSLGANWGWFEVFDVEVARNHRRWWEELGGPLPFLNELHPPQCHRLGRGSGLGCELHWFMLQAGSSLLGPGFEFSHASPDFWSLWALPLCLCVQLPTDVSDRTR